jgi:hypothetical protein
MGKGPDATEGDGRGPQLSLYLCSLICTSDQFDAVKKALSAPIDPTPRDWVQPGVGAF